MAEENTESLESADLNPRTPDAERIDLRLDLEEAALDANEEAREQIAESADGQRLDLDLEMRSTPAQLIRDIDLNKKASEQIDNVEILECGLYSYLVGQIQNGDIDLHRATTDLSYLVELGGAADEQELATLELISLILKATDSKMYTWLKEIPRIADEAVKFYDRAEKQKTEIEAGESNGWEQVNGKINTALLITGGAIVGGVLVNWAYKRYKKAKAETEEEKAKAGENLIPGKALSVAAGVLTAVTLGHKLLSNETVGNWVERTLGVSLDFPVLKEAVGLCFSGKFGEALDVLLGNVEVKDPLILEAAEVTEVAPRNLMMIADKDYKAFMNFGSQVNRQVGSFLFDFMPDPHIPFTLSPKERLEVIGDEKKLYKYLKNFEYILKDQEPQPKTVRQALEVLKAKGLMTKELNVDRGSEGETPDEEGELLDVNYVPHLSAALDKWSENGSKASDLDDLYEDIKIAAKKDGASLIFHDGVAAAWKGGKFVVISTVNILTQTLVASVSAAKSEDLDSWDVVETYADAGGTYYILGGLTVATLGGARAASNGNLAQGLSSLRTGARIAAAPFELAKLSANGAQRMYRSGNDWYYRGRQIEAPTRYQRLQWLHQRAKYQAGLYEKYYNIKHGTSLWAKTQRELLFGETLNKHTGTSGRLDALLQRHGKAFSDTYRELQSMTKVGERLDPWGNGAEDRQNRTSDKAKEFTEGHSRNLQLIEEAEVAARAKILAEKLGGPESDHMKQARTELNTEAAQPKPKSGITTHTEAIIHGFTEVTPESMAKLKNLGVTEQAILTMRERSLTPQQVENIIRQLEPRKTRTARLRNLEYLMHLEEAGPVWRACLKGMKVMGVLGVAAFAYGINHTDDKLGFMTHALAGGIGFFVALAGTQRGTMGRIPNPVVQQVVAFAGAFAIMIGADIFWDDTGGYLLDRNAPDRVHTFASDRNGGRALEGLAFTGAIFDMVEWAGESVGIGKGVEASTDPIDYLQDTVKSLRPFSHSGWDKSIFKDWSVHGISDLEENAASELEDKEEELNKFKESMDNDAEEDKLELEKLITELRTLKSFVDGSWVDEARMGMELREAIVLRPAEAEFRRLAAARFDEEGGEVFDRILTRMRSNEPIILDPVDDQVWKFMIGEEVEVNEVKLSFREFTTNVKYTSERMAFLNQRFPQDENIEETGEEEFNLEAFENSILYYENTNVSEVEENTNQVLPESGEVIPA
jgi:predicted  nucleic acid-binding Zn-ribbon protein